MKFLISEAKVELLYSLDRAFGSASDARLQNWAFDLSIEALSEITPDKLVERQHLLGVGAILQSRPNPEKAVLNRALLKQLAEHFYIDHNLTSMRYFIIDGVSAGVIAPFIEIPEDFTPSKLRATAAFLDALIEQYLSLNPHTAALSYSINNRQFGSLRYSHLNVIFFPQQTAPPWSLMGDNVRLADADFASLENLLFAVAEDINP